MFKFRTLMITMLILSVSLTSCSLSYNKNVKQGDPIEIIEPYKGDLELPIIGATGYTPIALDLKNSANTESETLEVMEAGTGFKVVKEEGDWWFIEKENSSGWVEHKYCMVNLPDVIPSIIYNNTNTYSSKLTSSRKSIPKITGNSLYSSKSYNERLGKEEYIMPVLYSMSKKIYLAQKSALANENSLILYESYRPRSVQKSIVTGLSQLAKSDSNVMTGINTPPWDISWFIATSLSNHQKGSAIDVSLANVNTKENITVGDYLCINITDYAEYTMPTPIHELSISSITFSTPISSKSQTAWKSAQLANSMTESAVDLQNYCTAAGLTPLASEWWHFNDLDTGNQLNNISSEGNYTLTKSYSTPPTK